MTKNTRRERLGAAGQLLAGILVIVIIILILQNLLGYVQVQSAPPGWQILRPPHEVSTLIIVNDTVWTGGKEGVILIDRNSGTRIGTPGNVPSFGYVRQILRDRDGGIWVGHDGGLARYRNSSWEVMVPAPEGTVLKGTQPCAKERWHGCCRDGSRCPVIP